MPLESGVIIGVIRYKKILGKPMNIWQRYLAKGVFEPAFRDTDTEKAAKFNSNMYPNGVNADFMNTENKEAREIVTFFQDKFEGEARDIAHSCREIVQLMCSHGLKEGSKALDVGAGTGSSSKILV